jgi:hypothetical protein
MRTSGFTVFLFILTAFIYNACSETSVRVFSKDEALNEKNISKPRIFIKNTGTKPIRNFYCYYYFTVEHNMTPVLENYYTPNETVTLEHIGGKEYAVRYDFSGVTLHPGQILPDKNGNAIGIHYTGWEPLYKDNDYSFNPNDAFSPNENIDVYLADGHRIYGYESHQRSGNPHKRTVVTKEYTQEEYPPERIEEKKKGNSIHIDINLHK